MSNSINQNVASCRKLVGLKQSDVAEKLNLKTSTYSQMERKGNITAEMIVRLAELFKISPLILLYGLDYKEEKSQNDDNLTLSEPFTPPVPELTAPADTVFTNREENSMKITRNLSKNDREEVFEFIEAKYKKKKVKIQYF